MKKILMLAAACLLSVMMFAAQCAATTKKGTQCKRQASPGSEFCWQHGGTTKKERAAGMTAPDPDRLKVCAVRRNKMDPVSVANGRKSKTVIKSDNLDLGVPGWCDQIVEREGYALGYVEAWEQPAWVAYRLTGDEVMARKASRMDAFAADPEIRTGSATPEDYAGSGYDRGHLAPAADMHWSDRAMLESFYMSNMSPQEPAFNRGAWARLEQAVRRFAYSEGILFVVTGPIVTEDDVKTIGFNKVRVPGFYYKVVYDETPPEKMIAFILPNNESKKPLDGFVVSVDDVEKATGLDFFSALPPEKQARLESKSDPDAWTWRDSRRGGRERGKQ